MVPVAAAKSATREVEEGAGVVRWHGLSAPRHGFFGWRAGARLYTFDFLQPLKKAFEARDEKIMQSQVGAGGISQPRSP